MPIAKAFKLFIKALVGKEPVGDTISQVIRDGAKCVSEFENNKKEILLKSSTPESTKIFVITVTDNGTITATEKQ